MTSNISCSWCTKFLPGNRGFLQTVVGAWCVSLDCIIYTHDDEDDVNDHKNDNNVNNSNDNDSNNDNNMQSHQANAISTHRLSYNVI